MWFQPFCNRLKIAAIIIIENRGKSTTNSNTLNIVWCCHEANNNNNNKYVSAKRKTGFWINDWTNDESKREWKKLIGYTFAVCKIKKIYHDFRLHWFFGTSLEKRFVPFMFSSILLDFTAARIATDANWIPNRIQFFTYSRTSTETHNAAKGI